MERSFRRYRVLFIAGVLFLAAYTLFGFLFLPGLLRPRLTLMIEQQTGRRVRVAGIATNPFTLAVTLREFSLGERDSSTFLGFRELYLNYDVTSLVRGEYRFDAIRVDEPFVAIRVLRNGAFSFQDILDSLRAGSVDDASGGAVRPRPCTSLTW